MHQYNPVMLKPMKFINRLAIRVVSWTQFYGTPQIVRITGPTWGPPGSCRPQVGPCRPHEPCCQGHHVHRCLSTAATMPLKFAANLSWLFTEAGPLDQRYAAAKDAGFQAVECALPYALPLETVAEARRAAGVEQVLINCFPGDLQGWRCPVQQFRATWRYHEMAFSEENPLMDFP